MSQRFHVNAAGEVKPCQAEYGWCPFASAEGHYENKDEDRRSYELFMGALMSKNSSASFTFMGGQERHAFTKGDCGHLARHLQKILRLPIYYLGDKGQRAAAPKDRRWSHFVNRLPDGRFIDVEGAWTEKELIERWKIDEIGSGWLPTAINDPWA